MEITKEVDNDFISYIFKNIILFEASKIDTSSMVSNLSLAIVLQSTLMEISGVNFIQESAAKLNNAESYSMISKLTVKLCIVHSKGNNYYTCILPCQHFSFFFSPPFPFLAEALVPFLGVSTLAHLAVMKCLVWWTCLSKTASIGLSRAGIITTLSNLFDISVQQKNNTQVRK